MSKKRIASIALVVTLVAALAVVPTFVKKDSTINLFVLVLLYIALASSWNILGGYAGQTSLGHAAFFGLGTLVTRLLWFSGRPLLLSLLVGGLVAVVLAMVIGLPAFKLRGAYFAIGTLALGQVLYVIVGDRFPMITSLPSDWLSTYQLAPRYYLFLAVAVVTVTVSYILFRSRRGLGLMAVREEEDAAESLGVSGRRHKLLALGLSAFLAGLTGGAFAYFFVGYYPQFPFGPVWSFDAVTITYIGGTGTLIGPIIGAVFYVVVKELLALNLAEFHLIIFGILFVLVVLFLPGGLVEAWTRIRGIFARKKKQKDSALPVSQKGI